MGHLQTVTAGLLAAMMSGSILADDTFSMIGTWKGLSNSTVMGAAKHHQVGQNAEKIKFVRTEFTLVVDAQEGQNFAGQIFSAHGEEVILGALTADRKSGVMVDNDGIMRFEIYGENQFEHCYAHAPESANQHTGVAACVLFTRQ